MRVKGSRRVLSTITTSFRYRFFQTEQSEGASFFSGKAPFGLSLYIYGGVFFFSLISIYDPVVIIGQPNCLFINSGTSWSDFPLLSYSGGFIYRLSMARKSSRLLNGFFRVVFAPSASARTR
jgi:hypothetical protein